MKKLLLLSAIALLAQQTISAETFRVNNTPNLKRLTALPNYPATAARFNPHN